MIICLDCGYVFEENEAIKEERDMGKIGLSTAYEEYLCCPHCKSSYIEDAVKCEACEEWKCDYDIINGVCEACISKSINIDNVMSASSMVAHDDEEINRLAVRILGIEFINGMVENFIELYRKNNISQYILTKWLMDKENWDIRDAFIDMLKEGKI